MRSWGSCHGTFKIRKISSSVSEAIRVPKEYIKHQSISQSQNYKSTFIALDSWIFWISYNTTEQTPLVQRVPHFISFEPHCTIELGFIKDHWRPADTITHYTIPLRTSNQWESEINSVQTYRVIQQSSTAAFPRHSQKINPASTWTSLRQTAEATINTFKTIHIFRDSEVLRDDFLLAENRKKPCQNPCHLSAWREKWFDYHTRMCLIVINWTGY